MRGQVGTEGQEEGVRGRKRHEGSGECKRAGRGSWREEGAREGKRAGVERGVLYLALLLADSSLSTTRNMKGT
jgi:hypothetical protein